MFIGICCQSEYPSYRHWSHLTMRIKSILLNNNYFFQLFLTIRRLFFHCRLKNNAFLNDSFIETPDEKPRSGNENDQNAINKKSASMFSTSNLAVITEKGESSGEATVKRDSTSRQLKFDDSIGLSVNKKEPDRPKISLFSKLQSNDTSKRSNESTGLSDASWKTKSDVKSVDSLNYPIEALTVTRTSSAPTELQTPKVKSDNLSTNVSVDVSQKPNIADETPYKTLQLPPTATMRRVQSTSQHRTLLASANQPRKCRTELENEFRSQKVLFTTPSAVSRPAMKVMNHLGLDDSLNCYKSSPMVYLPPVKEERNNGNKDSSVEPITDDELYTSIDKHDGKINAANADSVISSAAACTANESEDKKKTININGKDFEIQCKIGQGGSSSVFLVEHKDTKLQCALKVKFTAFYVCFDMIEIYYWCVIYRLLI